MLDSSTGLSQSTDETPSGFSDDQAEEAQRALVHRPRISIRLRIALGFLLTFIITCGITIAAMLFISNLAQQQQLLEKAGNFEFEIQQARRFEKNYFLYGTNLYDALNHMQNARNILETMQDDLRQTIGEHAFTNMYYNLNRYTESMNKIRAMDQMADSAMVKDHLAIESELRNFGSAIVADASNTIDQERLRTQTWLKTSMFAAISALVFILVIEILLATSTARQIIAPFSRFEKYTKRIARGDFRLITPARKYRDEFTNLAIALNNMLIELKRREDQLIQSRKMAAIGTLTAGIAHELNNPLNNASLTTEAMIDEFDDWDKDTKLKMLRDIYTQLERAGSTVANLLDFTRRDEELFEELSINEVLNRTLKLVTNEINLNVIELELELGSNLPRVKGNHHNLQQVFLNLFLNAIQAMPEGGKLLLRSFTSDNSVQVDVSDSGVGILKDNLERIFEPFFTTKEVGKGTGLGLSVSYGIIEKHHGTIHVKSDVGKGTTFSIILPIAGN
jgi:two-component system NtrC family sensor kinase